MSADDSNAGETPPDFPEDLILRAIAEHLQKHTGKRKFWRELRDRPDLEPYIGEKRGKTADRHFWRLRGRVSTPMNDDKSRPHKGRAANEEHADWAKEYVENRREKRLPVTPSEAFWMSRGLVGEKDIDVGATLTAMMASAQRLHDQAYEDDGETIRDWKQLKDAIKLQDNLIKTRVSLEPDLSLIAEQQALVRTLAAIHAKHLHDQPQLHAEISLEIAQAFGGFRTLKIAGGQAA